MAKKKSSKKSTSSREQLSVRFLDGHIEQFAGDVVMVENGAIFVDSPGAKTVIPLRNVRYYGIQWD